MKVKQTVTTPKNYTPSSYAWKEIKLKDMSNEENYGYFTAYQEVQELLSAYFEDNVRLLVNDKGHIKRMQITPSQAFYDHGQEIVDRVNGECEMNRHLPFSMMTPQLAKFLAGDLIREELRWIAQETGEEIFNKNEQIEINDSDDITLFFGEKWLHKGFNKSSSKTFSSDVNQALLGYV